MDSNSNVTMDAIITFLGQAGEPIPPDAAELTKAAVNILFALSEEGARTVEDAIDILHDYQFQARQYATLQKKHLTVGKTFLKDGVWHCPDCNRRVAPNHSFCHRCGKKLGWR